MPDKYSHKEKPAVDNAEAVNWTMGDHVPIPAPSNINIDVSDYGIKIERDGVIFLDMSYGEIADMASRFEAMEAEIGRLWAALQGKLEIEVD